jgi:two-component system sensor histidine kinase BaeS
MRTLTVRLTLAFVLIGLLGAMLVAVLATLRTRSEFDRFISERDTPALVAALTSYYTEHGSWDGVGQRIAGDQALAFFMRDLVLADARGMVVIGRRGVSVGAPLPDYINFNSQPLQVQGVTVGYMSLSGPGEPRPDNIHIPPPERAFLERVAWATAISTGLAALIALVVGVLLARTLTRPLHELTAATQAMARGTLGQRVEVRSRDEIGELASAFNQMSADLAHSSQLRKQMTADLAHDLRTPLSILRGYTEGLQDGRLAGSPNVYTVMHGEVEHLQRLVEDLRVLSLADAGELPLSRRQVDPAALLERTGLAYIVQAEQHGVALRVEAPEGLPSIWVDTDRMTQVLNNLVSNALRYTPSGEIVLSAAAAGQQVLLTVRDTGSGIAAEDLSFVFDRFYRADKARQRGDNGESGLGLAISKAIVEAHGGAITVTSKPGLGTTFTIMLPVAAREATPRDGQPGQAGTTAPHAEAAHRHL